MKAKLLALAVAVAAVLAGGGVAAADQAYSPDDQPTDPADDRINGQGDGANASDEYDEKIPAERVQPIDLDGFDITLVEPEPEYDEKVPAEDVRKIDLGEKDIDIEVVDPEYDKKIPAVELQETNLESENVSFVGDA